MSIFFYLLCTIPTFYGEIPLTAFGPTLGNPVAMHWSRDLSCGAEKQASCEIHPIGKDSKPYWASPARWEHFAKIECAEVEGYAVYSLVKVDVEK